MKKEQKGLIPQGDEKTITNQKVEQTELDRRRAAYALNLCTVSISQIIDYEDLNILEQEYEMILNNLNLENFPKDESLLHILKQILDTVTFFRIYEGDKKILEKKYQQKMKNAIWSAIPNFTFVAGGDPYAIAISAIASVGMGYMNYRKEKAKISLENEEEEWKLQRSAIEQFNGLRREMFDTAWRLADTYGFKDEDRLTEKQIFAYNKILMDPIPLRRFERLNAIQNCFNAYPPFWYNLGNAAHEVAKFYNSPDYQHHDIEYCLESISKYRSLAEAYYHKYLECDHSLLRTDYIRSSCCLEYAALLLERNSESLYGQVQQLIADAEKYASEALDVLQICAIYSLKINDVNTCQRLLRKLVIEEFNTTTNAQLLSYVYLNVAYENKKLYAEKTKDYEELVNFADGSMLIPWANSVAMLDKKGVENLRTRFLDNQKIRIELQFFAVVDKIIEKCAIEYNTLLFQPRNNYYHLSESYYTDNRAGIDERIEFCTSISTSKDEWTIFVSNLRNRNIALVLNYKLNDVCRLLSSLVSQTLKSDLEKITSTKIFASNFNKRFLSKFKALIKDIELEKFEKDDFNAFINATFTSITSYYIDQFKKEACKNIDKRNSFQELISIGNELTEFCQSQNFPSPEQLCEEVPIRIINEEPREFVDILGFFDGAKNMKQNAEKEAESKAIIEDFIKGKKLFNTGGDDQKGIEFSTKEEDLCERRNKLLKKDLDYIDRRGSILAYFHDNKEWYNRYRDLYFLRKGFVLVSNATMAKRVCEYYEYDKVQYDNSKNLLYIDGVISEIYSSTIVNVRALYDLMKQLGHS